MAELEELLDNEKIVLVDGSSILRGSGGFRRLYETTRFHEIPKELVDELEGDLQEAFALFGHDSVRTIGEVSEEIKKVQFILGDKLSYLSDLDCGMPRSKRLRDRIQKGERIKRRLEISQQKARELWLLARERKLAIKRDNIYNLMFEIIKRLSEAMELKKDTSFAYGFHETDESYMSYTDEHLVCNAYCLSFGGESPVLLSSDTDLINLFGVIPRLMGSDVFLPFNEYFRERIKEKCPNLYFRKKGVDERECELVVDGSEIYFSDIFDIWKLNADENRRKQEEIRDLWEKLDREQQRLKISSFSVY